MKASWISLKSPETALNCFFSLLSTETLFFFTKNVPEILLNGIFFFWGNNFFYHGFPCEKGWNQPKRGELACLLVMHYNIRCLQVFTLSNKSLIADYYSLGRDSHTWLMTNTHTHTHTNKKMKRQKESKKWVQDHFSGHDCKLYTTLK